MNILKVIHPYGGFFSCCTVLLREIIKYYQFYKIFPVIDSSMIWVPYKEFINQNSHSLFFSEFNKSQSDIEFVKSYLTEDIYINNNIAISKSKYEDQFSDYSLINYKELYDFLKKYFSLNKEVLCIKNTIKEKYKIDSNLISVCYRGNDKSTETNLPNYEELYEKILEISNLNNDCRIFIQSDEIEFYEYIVPKIKNCVFVEEYPKIKSNKDISIQYLVPVEKRIEYARMFLAIMSIISDSKHLIINSGNVGMWACLFRGSCKNTHQYLNHKKSDFIGWKQHQGEI